MTIQLSFLLSKDSKPQNFIQDHHGLDNHCRMYLFMGFHVIYKYI